ncbi:TonB family C-terminal domain-containing protein [Arsukibacterium tuosuense]|uniref:Protein TonB n=1 Tax=Arsukibacterium tuosuense TaxID=1323745 RepID=A0A285JHI2_9GAMM|nr:TonB family protein [Arsukibacterium tuosuense]SNY59749.1 TonB family C-terminal domain-containing protein [Arsukibacterium tuosuense]
MRFVILTFLLLWSGAGLAANWLDAMLAYDAKDYKSAREGFTELLEVGNDMAAYNLAAMAYHGEGEDVDLVKAVSLFELAGVLGHPSAGQLASQLKAKLTPEQSQSIQHILASLQEQVFIPKIEPQTTKHAEHEMPTAIKRAHPRYPRNAAINGQFGYVNLRFLVDESGSVTSVDTLDAFPQGVFEKSAINAVKRWKYQPGDKKHLVRVKLDYTLGDGYIDAPQLTKLIKKENLWHYAVAGVPNYQEVLGTLLSLASSYSQHYFVEDETAKVSAELPDLSFFASKKTPNVKIEQFSGWATITLNERGIITEVSNRHFYPDSQNIDLLGLQVSKGGSAGEYRINRLSDKLSADINVRHVIKVVPSLTPYFWWELAARNGDQRAQQIMAANDPRWERYLLSKKDPVVMAWAGSRMILEGDRQQGMDLLEHAIALRYPQAKELKKQLM